MGIYIYIYKSMGACSDDEMRRAKMCALSALVSLHHKQNRNLDRLINRDTKNK
jgi:hypothetical protein